MSNETENVKQDKPASHKSGNVLLGTISYQTDEDLENFMKHLDLGQSIFILAAAVKQGQSRGIYNLDEAALIRSAVKVIGINSKKASEDKQEGISDQSAEPAKTKKKK